MVYQICVHYQLTKYSFSVSMFKIFEGKINMYIFVNELDKIFDFAHDFVYEIKLSCSFTKE